MSRAESVAKATKVLEDERRICYEDAMAQASVVTAKFSEANKGVRMTDLEWKSLRAFIVIALVETEEL